MTHEIKFIFFDLGKVLLNFSHQRLVDQVAALADKPADEIQSLLFEPPHDLENRFERGELNGGHFHQSFCEATGRDVAKDDLMKAVADIFWLNTSIVPLLTQLRCINFPMAILSNTCEAHWDHATRNFAAIGQLFDQRILSYEEQSMKPDSKIYESAICLAKQQTSCRSAEIFFTDDRQENVDAAISAGMQAQLYSTTKNLASQLRAGGVPIVG